jgi:hypothetical protein
VRIKYFKIADINPTFTCGFFCNTIPDWNKLPETIANSDSSKSLKEKLTHEGLNVFECEVLVFD